MLLLVWLYHHSRGRYNDFVVVFILASWHIRGRELAVVISELIIVIWRFAIFGYSAKSLDSDSFVLLVQRVD